MSRAAELSMAQELSALLGDGAVLSGSATRGYLTDATSARGLVGRADAVLLPGTVEEVCAVVRWCGERGVPMVPRGGGTGYAGGCVPDGGVVLALERLSGPVTVDPLEWRMHVAAGVTTARVRRVAREHGLYFPPDPGAAEQSQIGGNLATNAGGPHAFKYGVTGDWVTGIEAVVPPGEVVVAGGQNRKDVAGYALKDLFVGSEGTLGVVTGCWLRLIPAPAAAYPVVAFYPDAESGCGAVEAARVTGIVPAALEYLDARVTAFSASTFPWDVPANARFTVITEADGDVASAREAAALLGEALEPGALALHRPTARAEIDALWRWRDGMGLVADAQRGGKISEDVVVPADRLREAIESVEQLGKKFALDACSWGHAGDGNLHATFLLDPGDRSVLDRAGQAAGQLFELAVQMGGSVSGEHGIGLVKNGRLGAQWSDAAVRLERGIKDLIDPAGVCNPGKKLP